MGTLLWLTPAVVLAQAGGVIQGNVTDAATGDPVSDVTVTATSPSLQGSRTVVTDETGYYRIPQLPPGTYTITFDREAYRVFTRSNIQLTLDRTLQLNVQMLPETLQQVEEVIGQAPVIDVTNSTTGTSIGSEMIRNLPLVRPGGKGGSMRSFEALGEVAPGAQPDAYGISLSGTQSPENGFIVDGLRVNDPGFGVIGTPLSVEFVQEANVITGGYLPEYGRSTGGVLNVVTKSGSNEFHGSVFANFSPGAFSGDPQDIRREAQTINTETRLWNLGDIGAELGGPILRDRLWFYVGFSPSFQRSRHDRTLRAVRLDEAGNPVVDPETGLTQSDFIPGTRQFYFADMRSIQYIGKLTYLFSADHNLSLSVYGAPQWSGDENSYGFVPANGITEIEVGGGNTNGTFDSLANRYTSAPLDLSLRLASAFLNKRVLLDVSVGWHHQYEAKEPRDGSTLATTEGLAGVSQVIWRRNSTAEGEPAFHSIQDFEAIPDPSACDPAGSVNAVRCPVITYTTGGNAFNNRDNLDRYQGRAVGTLLLNLLGAHVIKAGVDVEFNRFERQKAYSGTVLWREGLTGTSFTDFRQYGRIIGPDEVVIYPDFQATSRSDNYGGFVQDSWNVLNQFTVNAGLRYDTQRMIGTDDRLAMDLANQWSPRIGAIWDPTREGRAKLFANYAKYFESVPLDLVDRSFPGERQITGIRFAAPNETGAPGCNPLDPAQQDNECRDPRNLRDLGDLGVNYPEDPNQFWLPTPGDATVVDTSLNPQSTDEIVVGAEYQLFANSRVGVTYTRRYMNAVIEDMSRDEATTYFIGNPGRGIATDFPRATRNYDAGTIYFNKPFSERWMFQASYTLSRLDGNYPGLFRPETLQLDPNINADFDLVSLLVNRSGPLPADATHQFKVYGAYELNFGPSLVTNLGLGYTGRSGNPTNYLGSHPIYGADEAFVLPRGSGQRLPWQHSINGHVGVGWRFSRDNTLTIAADVFNLFNFQAATALDERYTNSDVLPLENGTPEQLDQVVTVEGEPLSPAEVNPNFGNATQYQQPRTLRFTARVSF